MYTYIIVFTDEILSEGEYETVFALKISFFAI